MAQLAVLVFGFALIVAGVTVAALGLSESGTLELDLTVAKFKADSTGLAAMAIGAVFVLVAAGRLRTPTSRVEVSVNVAVQRRRRRGWRRYVPPEPHALALFVSVAIFISAAFLLALTFIYDVQTSFLWWTFSAAISIGVAASLAWTIVVRSQEDRRRRVEAMSEPG